MSLGPVHNPFQRARIPDPSTTEEPKGALQSPSKIESSAGKDDAAKIKELLEVGLADISIKSMAEVAGGIRAGASGKKGKGKGAGKVPGGGMPAQQLQMPMATQSTTGGSEADSLAEKIKQAVEKGVSATVAAAPVADAFQAGAGTEGALEAFSGDTSMPAVASDPSASTKAWALAPTRLKA